MELRKVKAELRRQGRGLFVEVECINGIFLCRILYPVFIIGCRDFCLIDAFSMDSQPWPISLKEDMAGAGRSPSG